MPTVKFRLYEPRLRPRQTRLEVPGWGGQREPRSDGSHEYAWHCLPFTEGAQYGLELFYPYDHELRVTTRGGVPQFDGDFGAPPEPGLMWPPFRNFGNIYYTYQLSLDLNPIDPERPDHREMIVAEPPGYALHRWTGADLVTLFDTVEEHVVLARFDEKLQPLVRGLRAEWPV